MLDVSATQAVEKDNAAEAFQGVDPFLLEPSLAGYSAQQVAVARTWAKLFWVAPDQQLAFVQHYLKSTSDVRCWVSVVESDGRKVVIMRLGPWLHWFEDSLIKSAKIRKQDRVPPSSPSSRAALGLAKRLHRFPSVIGSVVLTSFCRAARELAFELASEDLGLAQSRLPWYERKGWHQRYTRPRMSYYLKRIGTAIKAFCRHLDPEILFAVRSAQCPDVRLYNWLAAGDSLRRRQALRSQPVLLPLMIFYDLECTLWWPDAPCPWPALQALAPTDGSPRIVGLEETLLATAVDQGLSVTEVLAWLLQAPKSSLRFLGSCRPNQVGSALFQMSREGRNAGWHSLLLGATAGNRRPRSRVEWRLCFQLLEHIPHQVREASTLDLTVLLKGCTTTWHDPNWPKILATLTDYREFYRQLDDGAHEERHTVTDFFIRSSYPQIANKVAQFHRDLETLRAEIDAALELLDSDAQSPWRPLLVDGPRVTCPNGIEVVELLCPADLHAEGQALRHCVGGYDFSAYRGHCRLVSLRQRGKPLATAELCLEHVEVAPSQRANKTNKTHRPSLVCIQLRGLRNAPIDEASPINVAFTWFMQRVKHEGLEVNLNWPDHTQQMARYADSHRQVRLRQAVCAWIRQHLGRTS